MYAVTPASGLLTDTNRKSLVNPLPTSTLPGATTVVTTKPKKVGNRLLDLALTLVKRHIAMVWKSPVGPDVETRVRDVAMWAHAQEKVLQREEAGRMRRRLIADLWSNVVDEWEQLSRFASKTNGLHGSGDLDLPHPALIDGDTSQGGSREG
ncbi:hypothetical protein NDU88_002243 [Pleurodeles waltl]|uniref:Uncharacterized protein n=1 Tax=Pleurodeles waltl TaxID=8319 RepID=A0AAV7NI11_PLEWA|nr:hypothetical protein NDU88_002243 [Pleurodeles waltl]